MSPETLALLSGRILNRVTLGVTTNCWICSYVPQVWSGIPQIKPPDRTSTIRCDGIIYQFSGGTIPPHHTLHHVCQELRCVNPDHMRVVRRKYHAGHPAKTYTADDVHSRMAELRSQSQSAATRPSKTST